MVHGTFALKGFRGLFRRKESTILLLLYGLCIFLFMVDLVNIKSLGATSWAFWVEGMIMVMTVMTSTFLLKRLVKATRKNEEISLRMTSLESDLNHWKRKSQNFLQEFQKFIMSQFDTWQLTPAEKEVARLLLRGLGLKELAAIRCTSERTIRNQTQSIYDKSGLSGRHEFAAFFLQELLLPPTVSTKEDIKDNIVKDGKVNE